MPPYLALLFLKQGELSGRITRNSRLLNLSETWRRPYARTISLPFETRYLFCLYSKLLIDGHVKFNYTNRMYIRL